MPIYEYSCKKCGEVIERIQKFSDPPLRKHPGCGGALTKLISQSAFQLKGTGWYVTDYAKSGSKPEGTSDKGESGGSPESGASETKDSGRNDKKDKKEKKEKKSSPPGKSE